MRIKPDTETTIGSYKNDIQVGPGRSIQKNYFLEGNYVNGRYQGDFIIRKTNYEERGNYTKG